MAYRHALVPIKKSDELEKQDALNRDAQAAGLTVEELVASFTSLETSASSSIGIQASLISAPVRVPKGGPQTPSTRTSDLPPPGGQRTSTSESSRDLKTNVVTEGIVPQVVTPIVTIETQEATSELQTSVPAGDERTGAEDVQPSAPEFEPKMTVSCSEN